MKLQFKQGNIPKHLFDELEFQNYLDAFSLDYNLLPFTIINPLNKDEGIKHFDSLQKLESQLENLPKKKIFSKSKLICDPSDNITTSQLEHHDIYQLGQFIQASLEILQIEGSIALEGKDLLEQINLILLKISSPNYDQLRKNIEIISKEADLEEIKKNLLRETKRLEKKILTDTGIRMIYPYPHEVKKNTRISRCESLLREKNNNHILLSYIPHKEMESIILEKDELENQIALHYRSILVETSQKLSPFISDLQDIIQSRIKRSLQYAILEAKESHKLVLPTCSEKLRLKEAVLPSLKSNSTQRYEPLNLDLKKGVSVLFGANMTGKTTVLKTLFFHLTLIRFGLPVPAKSITLPFPEDLSIHLRSSGNTQRNLSSFGEELNFFSKKFKNGEYILVDEFFHSTNPTSGVELSKIFIDDLNQRDLFFFCNSHYKDILECKNIELFRMKDADLSKKSDNLISDLMNSIPFRIEQLDSNSFQKDDIRPLEIALHFPLDERLKDKIMEKINHGKS